MRSWTLGVGFGIAGLLGASLVGACGSSTCDFDATCNPATPSEAGADQFAHDVQPQPDTGRDVQSGGDADAEPPVDAPPDVPVDTFVCQQSWTPKDNACVLDNTFGVFVAPAPLGSDSAGDGSREKPYATISKAVANVGQKPRVFVCNGTGYTDQVTIAGASPLAIYGGLSCPGVAGATDWAYLTGTKAKVTGMTSAFVLKINAATAAVDVEDMDFEAPDAPAGSTGASSFAVIVNASTNVSFHRVTMTAGNATDGAPGSQVVNYPAAVATAPAGKSPDSSGIAGLQSGATPPTCTACVDSAVSTAGGGSAGTATALTPGKAGDGTPVVTPTNPPGSDGVGGSYDTSRTRCSAGDNGSSANAKGSGGSAGTDPGSLSAGGWTSANGAGGVGTNGGAAQGGGGGSGARSDAVPLTGGGGSGGCGGCGGGHGTGGTPGGSSIALVSVASTVNLDVGCVLSSKRGGNGGKGGDGQGAQAGGGGANGAGGGCPGGNGGNGGDGAGGGGGAGGHSLPIAYSGTLPAQNGATLTPGTAGPGGQPGAKGSPGTGANGTAAPTKSF